MSNIIAGNGGRGGAATAITVALILMASSPAILMTEAFASPISNNKGCKDIQFRTFEQNSFVNGFSGKTIAIGTPQHEYSVKIDYFRMSDSFGVDYFKNVAAKDPRGRVLLPGGETITITLQTNEEITGGYRTHVILYNHKVSDCDILLNNVKDTDKMAFEIVSIEQTDERQRIAKLTVRVPDASDVDKHFTKLLVDFPYSPEAQEYYLISHRVQVS
jgi:hypothetical protein